jgi:hypothetical protein
MRVRIEATISTSGNQEAYLGYHLGHTIIGRPLRKMVVTFEDDVNEAELLRMRTCVKEQSRVIQSFVMGANAIQIHSFRYSLFSALTGGWSSDRWLEERPDTND